MISIFIYSMVFAQGICSYSESSTGSDQTTFVEFVSFDCVDTVTNAFITEAEIDVNNLGGFCPSWYSFDLEINGSTVAEDLCSINAVDLSFYNVDINNLTSVKVLTEDEDNVSDNLTLTATLDLTYIVTTCPPPSGVEASNINPTTAEISWTSNGSELLWNLEVVNLTLGDTATGVATDAGVSSNPFGITGLSADNNYAVYVQADCGPFNSEPLSGWSFEGTFITPPTCLPLGGITIDTVTETTVGLSWLQAGTETAWDIELINISLGDTFSFVPNNAGLGTNNPTLTGLLPETDYQFIVRGDCGVLDGTSIWTIPYSFTTLPTCMSPTDLELVSFTYEEIMVTWTEQDDETEYYIEVVNITLGETQTGTYDDSSAVTSYTATGLLGDSEYAIYVSANCGLVDGVSAWLGPLSVTTACDPAIGPYLYDVETHSTTTNSSIEDCWTSDPTGTTSAYRWNVDGSGSTPSGGTGPSGAFSGTNYFYVEASNGSEGAEASLNSQFVDMSTLTAPGLSFMYHMYGGNMGTLHIDVNDNGVWFMDVYSIAGEQQSADTDEWIEANVNLASYTNNVQIRFRAVRGDGFGGDISIDDISIDEGIGCYAPSSLLVDSLTSTSASVSWDDNNSSVPLAGWTMEYGAGGFVLFGGTQFPSVNPFYLISGLNPGETYDFYVQAICDPGVDTSEWSTVGTFTTPCAPLDVPYFYDVESQVTTTNSDLFVNCWTATPATGYSWDVDDNGSTGSADTGPDGAFSGDKYYFTEASSGSEGAEAELISPEVDLDGTLVPILQFRYHMYGSEMGTLHVDVFDSVWHDDEFMLVGEQQTTGSQSWIQTSVDLSAYSGVVRVRFRGERGTGFHGDISLDDIHIREQPTCFPPTITVDSTTTTSVSISLDTTGTFGDEWFIEMVDLSSGGTQTFVPTDSITSIQDAISGLQPATNYELFIFTDCGVEDSDWTSVLFQTDCAPIGDFFKDWEELSAASGGNDTAICWSYLVESSTEFARIYVSSSTGTLAHSPINFIRMYNQADLDAELLLISPELVDITAGTNVFTFWARSSFGDSPFEVGTISDIDDPNTFTPLYSDIVSNVYDSITVPFLSYTGTDTRIAIKFNPLTTFDYLFVDDVKWGSGPACALPVNLAVLEFTDEEVTLDWLNVSPDTSWGLELINVSLGDTFTNSATDTASMHPFTIGGLSENSIYSLQLTNDCETLWTAPLTFVTPWANDVGIAEIISPLPSGCSLGDSIPVIVSITNYGGQDQVGIPVELSWDDTTYFSVGSLLDTLSPGETDTFTLSGFYDFSNAIDSNFFVQTALASDSSSSNNEQGSSVTNLGNQLINVTVNTGAFAGEVYWKIRDSLNNFYVFEQPQGYSNNNTFSHDVCVYANSWYIMEAYDSYGDGWNGGTYEINRCGGIIIVNNDGNEVTNGGGGFNPQDLEVEEPFFVEECPDNDLALLSIDSIFSACGLGVETPYVTIMNFGNLDVSSLGATAQYNYGGGWIDFWDFAGGLSSQTDTVLQMPSIDMSISGQYTLQVQILFAADEDSTSNFLEATVVSVPNLIEDSASFNLDFGGWTTHLSTGVNNSWEWGTPTTPIIGSGNDGKVWATNLTGDGALNEESYVLSPCYDFSSYTNEVELSYDFIRVSFSHSFRLEYELDDSGTWTLITTAPSSVVDWTHQITLLNLAGESSVRFRWFYDSSFNNPIEGFAFDNWEVSEHIPYTDASLSDLAVNGNTVSDPVTYDPDVLFYNYINPYGTTLWVVTAAVNAPFFSSMVIDEPLSLPGIATVTVTAEDTNFVTVYSINMTEMPPATDATLSDIVVSNVSVAGFDPDTLCYDVTFPAGSTFLPSISATATDPNATVLITNTNIPGTANIEVTAQDGTTTLTYCVNYIQSVLSTDALLSDLTLDGVTVPGFDPDTLNYTVELADTVTIVPLVGYATSDGNASAIINAPGVLPGIATVTVTAEDGFTMLVYTINITLAPSSNANLLDLTINGGTVIGFDASITVYSVELPFNSLIPTVVGLAEDPDASVVVIGASSVPGTTTVTVTAEDGVTTKVYFINWSYAAPLSNADLASLESDTGSLAPNFHPDSLFYTNCVGDAQVEIAGLTFTLADTNATWQYLSVPQSPYEDYIIEVTAQDGVTVKVYTIDLNECWPIGLNEITLEQIVVSPNPSNGFIKINFPVEVDDMRYSVIDQLGKIVHEGFIQNPGLEQDLDLTSLPSGVYNLSILTDKERVVKRISILK